MDEVREGKNDVYNPQFWKERIDAALERDQLHEAVFFASKGQFDEHTGNSADFLQNVIDPKSSVLDVGCGYGRFFELYPQFEGEYIGIDISPDFIQHARRLYPRRRFFVADMRTADLGTFDWVLTIGVRNMVRNNISEERWLELENKYRSICRKGLIIMSLPLVEPPYILSPL